MKRYIISALIVCSHFVSCDSDTYFTSEQTFSSDSLSFELTVGRSTTADPYSIDSDDEFSSLAIFIFDNNGRAIEAILYPSLPSLEWMTIPLSMLEGHKHFVLLANYADKIFMDSSGREYTISEESTLEQLEGLTTSLNVEFDPANLLMIASQSVELTAQSDNGHIEIPLRRLVSRLDLYIFKGAECSTQNIVVESAKLVNQIKDSEVVFQYSNSTMPSMLSSPEYADASINLGVPLNLYDSSMHLLPQDAQVRFYSYQNLVTANPQSPQGRGAPYLEITLSLDGEQQIFGTYLATNVQYNRYSLLQNNLYQVIAELNFDTGHRSLQTKSTQMDRAGKIHWRFHVRESI